MRQFKNDVSTKFPSTITKTKSPRRPFTHQPSHTIMAGLEEYQDHVSVELSDQNHRSLVWVHSSPGLNQAVQVCIHPQTSLDPRSGFLSGRFLLEKAVPSNSAFRGVAGSLLNLCRVQTHVTETCTDPSVYPFTGSLKPSRLMLRVGRSRNKWRYSGQ